MSVLWSYHNDDKIIPVEHQPASLIDLALARDVNSHQLLRGTGLFYDSLHTHSHISPLQLATLLDNACHLINNDDTSLQWGARLLPGHYGAISTVLTHSVDLESALLFFRQYRHQFCPVIVPRIQMNEHHICVYWLDVTGLGKRRSQWIETMASALTSFCHWHSGERWPWRYLFSHRTPDNLDHYHAYLGSDLHFDCHVDAMVLPRRYGQKRWPRAAKTVAAMAQQSLTIQQGAPPADSFVEALYQHVFDNIRQPPSLDALAAQCGISVATCKRKLAAHDLGYQSLLDNVRKHVALYLYWANRYNSEDVAHYLGFHDATNFRRSFKRWTGIVPSTLKDTLPQW